MNCMPTDQEQNGGKDQNMMYLNEISTKTLMNMYKKSCAELREFLYIFEDQYLRNDIELNKETSKAAMAKKKEDDEK